ncbi:MAG: hypothetical protein BIFFINMI_04121 [Phycisphaerae bacterium]|nr:hypothetical protein [Phycisphaerae bacterium]
MRPAIQHEVQVYMSRLNRVLILAAALGLGWWLTGCIENKDDAAADKAREAQAKADSLTAAAIRAQTSSSLEPESRDAKVAATWAEARAELNKAKGQAANYWPLDEQIACIAAEEAEYWAGRSNEELGKAQARLDRVSLQQVVLHGLQMQIDAWKKQKETYKAAQDAIDAQIGGYQDDIRKWQDEIGRLNQAKSAAEADAAAKRREADPLLKQGEELRQKGSLAPDGRPDLAMGWQVKNKGAKLENEAFLADVKVQNQDNFIKITQAKIDVAKAHVETLKQERGKYDADKKAVDGEVTRLTGAAVAAAGGGAENGPLPAASVRVVNDGIAGDLDSVAAALAVAVETLSRSAKAYAESTAEYEKAANLLRQQNSAVPSDATPEAKEAAVDDQAAIALNVHMASAGISQGALGTDLVSAVVAAASKATQVMQDLGRLPSKSPQVISLAKALQAAVPAGTSKVTLGDEVSKADLDSLIAECQAALKTAADDGYAKARRALEAASRNPKARQTQPGSKQNWIVFIDLLRTRLPAEAGTGTPIPAGSGT